ncbi:MAG: SemiSWEET transporter [Niastella sp.]|nr:SemiSWEET transporter [Niastella sp.]
MDTTQIIGIGASIGTGISLLPQLIKLVKEKKTENVSIGMMLVLLSGLVLWIIYGIRKEDWIIIISNGFSILLNLTILILSSIYKKRGTSP